MIRLDTICATLARLTVAQALILALAAASILIGGMA